MWLINWQSQSSWNIVEDGVTTKLLTFTCFSYIIGISDVGWHWWISWTIYRSICFKFWRNHLFLEKEKQNHGRNEEWVEWPWTGNNWDSWEVDYWFDIVYMDNCAIYASSTVREYHISHLFYEKTSRRQDIYILLSTISFYSVLLYSMMSLWKIQD